MNNKIELQDELLAYATSSNKSTHIAWFDCLFKYLIMTSYRLLLDLL